MRNATVKASIMPPPPNSAAQICSRANPSKRLHITARPMIPAALVFRRSVRLSGAITSAAIEDWPDGECGLGTGDLVYRFAARLRVWTVPVILRIASARERADCS